VAWRKSKGYLITALMEFSISLLVPCSSSVKMATPLSTSAVNGLRQFLSLLCRLEVVSCLEVKPILRRLPEGLAEKKRHLNTYGTGPLDDMGHSHGRNPTVRANSAWEIPTSSSISLRNKPLKVSGPSITVVQAIFQLP